jgi:hypothetical protein
VKERLLGVSAMLTLSVARTRIVYESSAGKLEAAKVYDQLPAESDVVFQTSEAEPNEEPFQ